MKMSIITVFLCCLSYGLLAQIEDEISGFKSTANGILIKKVSETEKNAILNPEEGLLVYQTTAPAGFYYSSGAIWNMIANANDVNDADADPINEIQNLNSVLTQSNDAGNTKITNLMDPVADQDAATKKYVDDNDDINDADADASNELQTLSKSGYTVTLSDGGGSFTDDAGSDDQNISGSGLSGTTLTIAIENGSSEIIDLVSLQDGTGTDDQTLSEVLSQGADAGNTKITNLMDPAADQDAATKKYVDDNDDVNDADADASNEIELPSGGSNGQVLSTNGSGTYSWINNGSGSSGNTSLFVLKAVDQTATDETMLIDDLHFVFSLEAGKTYKIEASLEFEENGTADASLGWNYSGSITNISYGMPGISISGAHITDLMESNKVTITSSPRTELLLGFITTSSSGTLTFQYAPFDDGGGTKSLDLNANSFMILTKLD